MRMTHLRAALFGAALTIASGAMALAEQQSFEDPTFGRYRLDYCRFEQVDCGIMAARAFCIREGYDGAASYRGERDVLETQRIGDRGTCRGRRSCDGFAEIVCERADPEPAPDTTEN